MISYTIAKTMKELGFTQKRHDKAMYYINESTISYFEDIKNSFEAKRWEESRNEIPVIWLDQFTYIPELIDLIGIQSYDLTLEVAAYHFIEGKKSMQSELIKKTEDATQNNTENTTS